MTTATAFHDFKNKLKTIYEDRESENITDWVFENVTGSKRWQRRESQDKELEITASEKIIRYLQELLKHKPVQYVLEEAWFYKLKFYVNEYVLIPRPETEELIEWIIEDYKREKYSKQTNIIDIGTGSGCIPVILKRELQNTNIAAIDVSEKALSIAKKNAESLEAQIDFFQIDFLNEHAWKTLGLYDTIVSNPPYIPINEKESLARNVTDFEPWEALFVAKNDPFVFYKYIEKFTKLHLNENGNVYVEVHEAYAKDVKQIFESAGFNSEIKKDIYGKDRMVKARKSAINS